MIYGAGHAALINWLEAGPYFALVALLCAAVYALVAIPTVRRMSGKSQPGGTQHLAPWAYEI
jgi:hypothetical protein